MKRMVKKAGDLDKLADVIQEDETGVTIGKNLIVDGTITSAGGSSERELTLIAPYSNGSLANNKKIYLDRETYIKIADCYYETIKIYYNDGNPLGIFNVLKLYDNANKIISSKYVSPSYYDSSLKLNAWFGKNITIPWTAIIKTDSGIDTYYIEIKGYQPLPIPELDQTKFDALYKLADKPTQDGTYVLKATVSGGAVTYTWVAQ